MPKLRALSEGSSARRKPAKKKSPTAQVDLTAYRLRAIRILEEVRQLADRSGPDVALARLASLLKDLVEDIRSVNPEPTEELANLAGYHYDLAHVYSEGIDTSDVERFWMDGLELLTAFAEGKPVAHREDFWKAKP